MFPKSRFSLWLINCNLFRSFVFPLITIFMIKKMFLFSFLIAAALLLQNCSRTDTPVKPQPLVLPQKTTDSTAKASRLPVVDSTKMQFEVVFASAAQTNALKPAKLKYDKQGWISGEWDDNSAATLQAFEILKNFSYTDGCGNKIPYALAVAVNGRHQYDNREFGYWDGLVTYTAMQKLIENGWDIENHSYYHGIEGNYNFGNDWLKNIKELDDLLFAKIGYRMNGAVVPTSYENFPTAAKNYGYLFSSSQGTFDGMKPSGQPQWGRGFADFDWAPEDFSAFGRLFYDDWKAMEKDFIDWCGGAFSNYNSYIRFGSHGIDEAIFTKMMNYIRDNSKDKFAVLPTREIMEYRIVARQPIDYKLDGNKMIVTVDLKNLPARFRWKDMSFIAASSDKITAVTAINNIDKVSFNAETGLINIFKQTTKF